MSGPRYSIIPARFFDDDRLKPSHYKVMGYLGKHSDKSGWMKLSQTKAALPENIGIARETICRAITDLVDWGYVEKRTKQETKRSICFYRILMDDPNEPVEDVPEIDGGCDVALTGGCDRTDHRVVTQEITTVVTSGVTTKNVPSSNIKPNNDRRASAAPSEDFKSGFGSEGVFVTKAENPQALIAWEKYAEKRQDDHRWRTAKRLIRDHGFFQAPSLYPPDFAPNLKDAAE